MSSTFNRKQSFWKTVEAQLRSNLVGTRAEGVTALTAEDAASWSKTLVLGCLILQDLLPDGSRLRSDGSLKQWCITIAKADILIVARALKEFQLFLRCYSDEWAFLSYGDFKHRYPYSFTGDFWSPVKDILASFLADPQPASFKILNQWVSFPMKLTLKGLAGDLTQKSEQEFLDNENRLARLVLPETDCDALATVLGKWFSKYSFTLEFRPHHSNGAVANRDTKRGLLGKYRNMTSDYRIASLYRKFGLNEADYGFIKSKNPHVDTSDPCAKLITVPKGIDKRRMICPEPAEYQFNQQGIWDILDEFIYNDPSLSRHISIHDQNVNRRAALEASRFCDAATIDLSSASDSVSWALVKRVFRKAPELLWCLWATRSTSVKLPTGMMVKTNKYAPMGSALCFPIESILFAAICQVADDNTKTNRGLVIPERDTYHVYGDDIIVPQRCFEETCRILTACGFIVNEQKTFYPYSRFKESCGIESLDGVDVSPLGISRKFSCEPLDENHPELVACYVSLANDLWLKGFVAARSYVLAEILSMPGHLVPPFSGSTKLGIFSPQPTNWTSNRRFNSDLQEEEIQVGVFSSTCDIGSFALPVRVTDKKYGRGYDDIRYHVTLRRLADCKRSGLFWPEDLIRVSLSRSRLCIHPRWVPAWLYVPCERLEDDVYDDTHFVPFEDLVF